MQTQSDSPRSGSVAVIIAAYNAAATVRLAIESALAQPEAIEVWVIDDASTDETAKLAETCDDGSGRLRVVRQTVNGGPSRARNIALSNTRAAWVCVLDADDVFVPGRLARLLAEADGAEMVADAITRVASIGDLTSAESMPFEGRSGPWVTVPLDVFIDGNVSRPGRHREELGFIKPLMSTPFLRRHRLAYAEPMRLGEDFLLYAQVLAHGGRLRLGPACGYVALTRADSLSGRHSIDDLHILRDCTAQLAKIRSLTPAEHRNIRRHWRDIDNRLQWRRLIDAVKARDFRAALSAFHDPEASLQLVGKLAEQVWLRGRRRLTGSTDTDPAGSPTTNPGA